jgi:hypothetical protein
MPLWQVIGIIITLFCSSYRRIGHLLFLFFIRSSTKVPKEQGRASLGSKLINILFSSPSTIIKHSQLLKSTHVGIFGALQQCFLSKSSSSCGACCRPTNRPCFLPSQHFQIKTRKRQETTREMSVQMTSKHHKGMW